VLLRTPQDILDLAREQRVEFVNLQFIDIVGTVKSVTIPIDLLPDAFERGVWFDGSSVDGFARIAESDMYLVPDPGTYALVPWHTSPIIARLICDIQTPSGRPFPGDPRRVLLNALDEAAEQGFRYHIAPELEFFLFRPDDGRLPTASGDDAGYFDLSLNQPGAIRQEMVLALQTQGIAVAADHHEVAHGQHEIDFQNAGALQAADQVVVARTTIKALAQRHSLYATFMPKPVSGINGNGMHCHQNLTDLDGTNNLFADPKDSYGLSANARHFIAGQLAHAPAMIAVLAPLVNSYKRLVPGYEAPIYLSWSRTNRSSLVRVPRFNPVRHPLARVELRCPDPACNPYLAFAVMLKAGLDGVRRKLPLPEPAEEDLFQVDPRARGFQMLPSSLGLALDALRGDEVVQAALGSYIYERFVEAKSLEWADYRLHISQWELDRYLPIY
jgi:glutamine synthetase